MTIPSEPTKKSLITVLSSEVYLGTLVALLSIFTATAAYLGSIADSKEADANVEGEKILSLSNTEFLRVNGDIAQDYSYFDNYYIYTGERDDIAQYYHDNFSDTLLSSMDRADGPFDDQYYNEMYAEADGSFDEAMAKYDEAQAAGDKADGFQLDVLILAVALSLAAWASIVKEDSKIRPMFSAASFVIGLAGLTLFVMMAIK